MLDRLAAAAPADPEAGFAGLAAAGLVKGRDFMGAPLSGLDLRGEDLRGFNFTGADLRGSDLRDANMDGVPTEGANTTGALGLLPRSSGGPRPAPQPFDLEEARRMILSGVSPPPAWVPSI